MSVFVFFFQAEDGIRYTSVTGVQTCALPISKLFKQPHTRTKPATEAADILVSFTRPIYQASAIKKPPHGFQRRTLANPAPIGEQYGIKPCLLATLGQPQPVAANRAYSCLVLVDKQAPLAQVFFVAGLRA